MYRISIIAIIAAFGAELIADQIIGFIMLVVLGQGSIQADMTPEATQAALKAVAESPAFLAGTMIFGTATVVGGGYLAARIARRIPYYHGLAMGVVGLALQLFYWQMNPLWMNVIAVLTVIPMSLLGAHLAKRHIPPEE
jgi:hypothetical protein